jgi:hypothetical protein
MPEMAPTPHWCPPGLTPSQRRRIQRMRLQKMREEATEMERERSTSTSDDDMDRLDDEAGVEGEGESQRPCTHNL